MGDYGASKVACTKQMPPPPFFGVKVVQAPMGDYASLYGTYGMGCTAYISEPLVYGNITDP